MPSIADWKISASLQPKPDDYAYDLDQALSAVVGLRAIVPQDAFTADILGTERSGNAVFIRRDGLAVTIGYLITEAQKVWLTLSDGRTVEAHVVAYDQETGFGLVQALARIEVPYLPLGESAKVRVSERVVLGGAGGRSASVAARIAAKEEFAGNWEYVVDEAIFTTPSHPNWGGTALIGASGELLGIGSLQLEQAREKGRSEHLNMVVPIDLLKPILDDLMTYGRPNRPARPWLGLYATEVEDRIVVVGLTGEGPAAAAGLEVGDIVLDIAGEEVSDLAEFFRLIWAQGDSGAVVPMTVYRDGRTLKLRIVSGDRNSLLWKPSLH